ncbi:MAG: altronate dehydratase [Rhodospirillales bacterium]|nr:altronate dehydratase [Rhodospirillales bacterium]
MTSAPPRTVKLAPIDNVVMAIDPVAAGQVLENTTIKVSGDIPAGHKIATSEIALGAEITKFAQTIGFATRAIHPGDHIHSHNCEFQMFERDYQFGTNLRETQYVAESERATFDGFRRADGRCGTRNYIGILTSVNCSATVAKMIEKEINNSGILANYPNVDGVSAFVHGTGCGMAGDGDGWGILQRTQWGYARHANFAAVLMVGLGCEVNQIPFLLDAYNLEIGKTFQTLVIQEEGGTTKTIKAGVARIKAMLEDANQAKREPISASELTLALQCGGSDGYSGMTANPALGAAADILVRHGGTAILSETPEIYGAEHLLTRRAINAKVGQKLVDRIHWWEDYVARNNGSLDNNPSPGNKAGGLTTILEKSLGAAAKGGTTNLTGVFKYAELINTKGFVFMDSPGYDPASITGQVASGANLVCFTTGRGSAFGFKPTPSIKLATNTIMYNKMTEDMDINCGTIADGSSTVEEKGQEIFNYFLEIASGRKSKSEVLGYGDNEFVPWLVGAVM